MAWRTNHLSIMKQGRGGGGFKTFRATDNVIAFVFLVLMAWHRAIALAAEEITVIFPSKGLF